MELKPKMKLYEKFLDTFWWKTGKGGSLGACAFEMVKSIR